MDKLFIGDKVIIIKIINYEQDFVGRIGKLISFREKNDPYPYLVRFYDRELFFKKGELVKISNLNKCLFGE